LFRSRSARREVFVVVDLASRINQAAKVILEEIEGKRPTSDEALP